MKVYFATANICGTKTSNQFASEERPLFELVNELTVDQWNIETIKNSDCIVCQCLRNEYIDEMQILLGFAYSEMQYFTSQILLGQHTNKYRMGDVFVGTDRDRCAQFIGDIYMSQIK